MRQLLFDEIREADIKKIKRYLHKKATPSPLGEIFWIDLPEELYDEVQREHKDCQPFYFAAEVGRNYLRIEFLIRSRQRLHCACIRYANKEQRAYILDFADQLLERLKIQT
jgi:hypothetical protein